MANSKQVSVSKRNLFWLVVVIAVGLAAFFVVSWKAGLAAAIATLVLSEIVERTARKKRNSSG